MLPVAYIEDMHFSKQSQKYESWYTASYIWHMQTNASTKTLTSPYSKKYFSCSWYQLDPWKRWTFSNHRAKSININWAINMAELLPYIYMRLSEAIANRDWNRRVTNIFLLFASAARILWNNCTKSALSLNITGLWIYITLNNRNILPGSCSISCGIMSIPM